MDCVARVSRDGNCLEKCEGLIVNVMKTSEERQDKEQYKDLFHLYEKYKSPNVSEFTYFKKDIYDDEIYDLRGITKYNVQIVKKFCLRFEI